MVAQLLRSQRVAFVFMSVVIGVAITAGYAYFGWLGVSFVGLVGLVISLRAEIFEDYGDPHERNGGYVVSVYARQKRNLEHDGPEDEIRRKSQADAKSQLHRVINTIFGAIFLLGIGMLISHYL